jgi:BirA family biotin operon repressor/biotin-[acetyl-CoA-carboxylase] ligase
MVSLAAALAVVDTLAPWLPGRVVGIEWPNDVFAAGKKLAGILVEGLLGGLYVVGIGVNTNNTMEEAPAEIRSTATTLRDLTGRRHEPIAILVELLRQFEAMLRRLGSAPDQIGILADARCLQRGRELVVESGGRSFCGACAGIAPDGALLLDAPEGRLRLHSGTLRRE